MTSVENRLPFLAKSLKIPEPISNRESYQNGIVSSSSPAVSIPEVTFAEYAFSALAKNGNRPFLTDSQTGFSITSQDALRLIKKTSSALIKLQIKPGDIVCAFCSSSCEFAILSISLSAIGGILALANPCSTPGELKIQLQFTEATLLICDISNCSVALEAIRNTQINYVVLQKSVEIISIQELAEIDDGLAFSGPVNLDPLWTPLLIPFSSGTTGSPKGVLFTHYNAIAIISQMSSLFDQDEVVLCVLPMYHLYAMMVMWFSMASGSSLILMSKFKPKPFLSAIEKHKVTLIPLVPPLAHFLIDSNETSEYDLSSLKRIFNSAAPLASVLGQKLIRKFKLLGLIQGYGMTETCFVVRSSRNNQNSNLLGYPLSNTQLKIIDLHTGANLGPGCRGEICARGPQVIKSYLKNPEATNQLLDSEGWAHTGDIGYYDDQGSFYYIDRFKEIIKFKGHQVAPVELEALLLSHPAVKDAAVVGKPDRKAGELPTAFVVLRNCNEITKKHIEDFVKEKTSPEKHLRGGVYFVENIPKSSTGKLLRKNLVELLY